MSHNEEAPAGKGEGFEIDSCHPIPEESTNMSSIADAGDDGETLAEWDARDRAEQAAWLAVHPEVTAAKPEWSDTVSVHWEYDDAVGIAYERTIGHVLLSRWAMWQTGSVRLDRDTAEPEVVVLLRDDPLTVTQMRELASALMTAIPVVEQAHA
jgi:hypothetical protein